MKKFIICTALATCIGTFPTAADADKLIANSDTGVNIHAMENHLGIDRNAKTIVGYKTAENGTVLQTETRGNMDARGGVLANTPLTEAEQKAAADAGVDVSVQTEAEAQALEEAEAQAEAQSNANIEAAAGSETNGDATVDTGIVKRTQTKTKSLLGTATDTNVGVGVDANADVNANTGVSTE